MSIEIEPALLERVQEVAHLEGQNAEQWVNAALSWLLLPPARPAEDRWPEFRAGLARTLAALDELGPDEVLPGDELSPADGKRFDHLLQRPDK